MKQTKFEAIKTRQEKALKNRSELETRIFALTERERILREEAEAAAESGNVEEYKQKKAQAEDTAELSYVEKKKLEKSLAPVPEAELLEAWKEYMAAQDPKIKAADAAVNTAIKTLYEKFRALEEALKAAEEIRETCVELNGGRYGAEDWKERLAHFDLTDVTCNWIIIRDFLARNGHYSEPQKWTTGIIFGMKQSHA